MASAASTPRRPLAREMSHDHDEVHRTEYARRH